MTVVFVVIASVAVAVVIFRASLHSIAAMTLSTKDARIIWNDLIAHGDLILYLIVWYVVLWCCMLAKERTAIGVFC